MAQTVKILPAIRETQVQSLSQEDPLGEGNGNSFQYCCLENPWTEEPGGLQSMGLQKMDTTERLTHTHWSNLGGTSGKEAAPQCRGCKRRGLNPWVRKIP